MKEIVLKLYEFDELSKDSQERIIERERWNIMDCCMEAYGADYISTMKSFGDLTNTEAYGWEVGYTRYDFRFKFKYNDPIYCHPTDYDKDIYPNNLCGKLLFRYINNNIMPRIIKGRYFSTPGRYVDGKYEYKHKYSRVSSSIMAVNSNTIWYWIQPVTNGRSIAIRMIYWLLDVTGSHIARWRVLRDN